MLGISRQYLIKTAYIFIDIILIAVSIFVACLIRQGTLHFDVTLFNVFLNDVNPFRMVFWAWIVITCFINNGYNLYQTRREILEGVEVTTVFKSVMLSALFVVVGIFITKSEGFPRSIVIIATIFNFCFLSIWRVVKRFFVESLVASGYNNFNVLVVGAGKVGLALSDEIRNRPNLGLRVSGFLDDFKGDISGSTDLKVLGKLEDFTRVARKEFIHQVFITVHHDSSVFLKLLEEARDLGVAVRVVPQGFDLTSGDFCKFNIGIIPILEYRDLEYSFKQRGKRAFDFVASTCAFILLLPVFAILGLLIKIDSPGPIFYSSRRYGRKGNVFHMYKFRSMKIDADSQFDDLKERNEVDGPIFKIKNDPRITRFGRFLRKYSIDEVPQIMNVIKGDMSLVGPRPFPIEQIEKEDLKQLKRLEVRPGITGLWQIRGRSDISFTRLLRWDIWYINNWSFWLDLYICMQTIPVVIKGRGAY